MLAGKNRLRRQKMGRVYNIKYTPNHPIDGSATAMIKTRDKAVLDAVNAQETEVGSGPLFEVSETRRKYGLRPRGVLLGVRDSTYGTITKRRFVPIVTQTRWNQISLGNTFTLSGVTWTVIRKEAEEVGK
jgi:basic membrane lipoprotein Med (substrate-binding protein (PBP1-ABC) superfamily)